VSTKLRVIFKPPLNTELLKNAQDITKLHIQNCHNNMDHGTETVIF